MAKLTTSLRFDTRKEADEWLTDHGYADGDTGFQHKDNGTFAQLYDSGDAPLAGNEKRFRVRIFTH